MDIAVRRVDAALRAFIVLIFVVLTACVVWQATSRYVFSAPSTLTDEIARFLFIWVALFGAAYTLGQRRHLAINLFSGVRDPSITRPLNLLLVGLIAAFAGAVMIYGGGRLTLQTLASGQISPALRVPMGWVYAAIPASGLLMLFYCAAIARDVLGEDGRGPTAAAEGE